MSRFQKIFLASAFVAVGFGVAMLLGQPVLPRHVLNSNSALPPVATVDVRAAAAFGAAPQSPSRVRLLPDSPTTHAGVPAMSAAAATPEVPRLGGALAPVIAASDRTDNATPPRAFDFGPISSAPIGESDAPRAKLRNEAPRAVGVDPQSPASIRRLPADTVASSDPYKVIGTNAAPSSWSAPPLLNTGYAQSISAPPAATPASYAAPANSAAENQVAPPPWPMPEETAEARTHIVVDGDSLERLASRYLSDPQRGREIYELNRQLLSSPDLLPIGAELKIPDRVASASWANRGFQPNSSNMRSNSDVGRANMQPGQQASSPQGIIPRAQLAPPVMVQ